MFLFLMTQTALDRRFQFYCLSRSNHCYSRKNRGLKRDICNIQMAGTCRDQLESQTINDCIRADLKYACLYWVHHLQRSKQAMNDIAGTFLRTHFLHWLEVLSLLGELSSGVIAVRELSTMVKVSIVNFTPRPC